MHSTTTGNEGSAGKERSATGRGSNRTGEPLDAELLEALGHLDSGTLANAIETFQKRLRNEGFVDSSVHCLCPHLEPMVGYAATLKIRGSAPATAGGLYAEGTGWWDYVLSVPAPRVAVVQ